MPRYARNGDVSLAYDVFGEGERDILVTFGWVGSFQSAWELPAARALARAAGHARPGDHVGQARHRAVRAVPPDRLPTLEERMDDMRVVLDAAGSERAVAFGISEGASLSALFAASHPDRVVGADRARRVRADARTTRATTGPRHARWPTSSTGAWARPGATTPGCSSCGRRAWPTTPWPRSSGTGCWSSGHAGDRDRLAGDGPGHRRPRTCCRDPRADARDPPRGRPDRAGRARALPRRAHPGRALRRSCRGPTTSGGSTATTSSTRSSRS